MIDRFMQLSLKGKIKATALLFFLGYLGFAIIKDSNANSELKETKDPKRVAYFLLDRVSEGAESDVTFGGDVVSIEYKIDPWHTTNDSAKEQFLYHSQKLTDVYLDKFPELQTVSIYATANFIDRKGHEKRDNAMSISFFRDEASGVNWKNIPIENTPRLANYYWVHPAFNN